MSAMREKEIDTTSGKTNIKMPWALAFRAPGEDENDPLKTGRDRAAPLTGHIVWASLCRRRGNTSLLDPFVCPYKPKIFSLDLSIVAAVAASTALNVSSTTNARADRFDDIADSPMSGGRPTAEAAKLLKDELLFQRATQVYLWALPLINTLGMKVGSEQTFGAGYNVLPIWKDRLDARTLITTPNSDVLYAMSYADLGETGPLVFEAPPRMQGILLDFWQRPIPGPELGPL